MSARGKGSKIAPYVRRDGKRMRSTTTYLEEALHRKLALYCAEEERSHSEVIAEALVALFRDLERDASPVTNAGGLVGGFTVRIEVGK